MSEPIDRPRRGPAPLPGGKPKPERSWRFYAGIAIAIVALIFIFQNSQSVDVDFIFATASTPLFFVLIVTFALGALTGWLLPHVRRGRKRGGDD
jgi:lipopolysaccharide assembly protein A